MNAFSDPRLVCDVCHHWPASRVTEVWRDLRREDHREYLLTCAVTDCLTVAVLEAEWDGIAADQYPLTREDAEAISGLDLSEVTR